eukprot:9954018-Lingulodinium_polyedra.AAC.1
MGAPAPSRVTKSRPGRQSRGSAATTAGSRWPPWPFFSPVATTRLWPKPGLPAWHCSSPRTRTCCPGPS